MDQLLENCLLTGVCKGRGSKGEGGKEGERREEGKGREGKGEGGEGRGGRMLVCTLAGTLPTHHWCVCLG